MWTKFKLQRRISYMFQEFHTLVRKLSNHHQDDLTSVRLVSFSTPDLKVAGLNYFKSKLSDSIYDGLGFRNFSEH